MVKGSIAAIGRFFTSDPCIARRSDRFGGKVASTGVNLSGGCRCQGDFALGNIHVTVLQANVVTAAHLLIGGYAVGIHAQYRAGINIIMVKTGIFLIYTIVLHLHNQ